MTLFSDHWFSKHFVFSSHWNVALVNIIFCLRIFSILIIMSAHWVSRHKWWLITKAYGMQRTWVDCLWFCDKLKCRLRWAWSAAFYQTYCTGKGFPEHQWQSCFVLFQNFIGDNLHISPFRTTVLSGNWYRSDVGLSQELV